MARRLRALSIDDSTLDTELLVGHLEANGFEVDWRRVDTREDLRNALAQQEWDVALCDYVMPHLGGLEALAILREAAPDLPAITVSGNIGEEYAVNVMRAGAKDYVRKDYLPRLIPAIERELTEVEVRRQSKRLEKALDASEDRLRNAERNALQLTKHISIGTFAIRVAPDGSEAFVFASDRYLEMVGVTREELLRDRYAAWKIISPDSREEYVTRNRRAFANKIPLRGEGRVVVNGEIRWYSTEAVPRELPDGAEVWEGVLTDITDRKQAEAALRALASAREDERRLFQTVLDRLGFGVCVFAADGKLLWLNQTASHLYSMAIESDARPHPREYDGNFSVSRSDGTPVPVDDWPVVRGLRGEAIDDQPLRVRNVASGREWTAAISALPIRDAEGALTYVILTVSGASEVRAPA